MLFRSWAAALQLRGNAILGLTPAEAMRGVHVGQDTRFLQPIPRDRPLRTHATIVDARPVRTGALMVVRYATYDAEVLIADTLSRSIYRSVAADGRPAEAPASARVRAPTPTPAPTPASMADLTMAVSVALPRGFAHLYSECADIWNPIHTERSVALAAGLPDIIVHGTALWALAGLTLMRHVPARRLSRLACRFAAPLTAGEDAVVRFGAEGHVASFEIHDGQGSACVRDGIAEFGS